MPETCLSTRRCPGEAGAYRCPFEILAPLALESAQVARITACGSGNPARDPFGLSSLSSLSSVPGPFVALFIRARILQDGPVASHHGFATYYRRRSGTYKLFKRLALPVRQSAAEAEYDLISYADNHRWFRRPRQQE